MGIGVDIGLLRVFIVCMQLGSEMFAIICCVTGDVDGSSDDRVFWGFAVSYVEVRVPTCFVSLNSSSEKGFSARRWRLD